MDSLFDFWTDKISLFVSVCITMNFCTLYLKAMNLSHFQDIFNFILLCPHSSLDKSKMKLEMINGGNSFLPYIWFMNVFLIPSPMLIEETKVLLSFADTCWLFFIYFSLSFSVRKCWHHRFSTNLTYSIIILITLNYNCSSFVLPYMFMNKYFLCDVPLSF